jgi:hypothetical protein
MALGVFQHHNAQTKFRKNRPTGSKADMWDMQVHTHTHTHTYTHTQKKGKVIW